MKTTDKPTLSDLFESKKLDVPSDQFWDDFQEQVKVRALTTVVQRRSPSPFAKLLFFSVPSFCACALAVFLFLEELLPLLLPAFQSSMLLRKQRTPIFWKNFPIRR